MNCPAMPPGGGSGMKFRKPFRPKTRKIAPARYRAIVETVLITGFSFSIGSHYMASIILLSIELMMYTLRGFRNLMAQGIQQSDHVWLVMMKAMRALTRYAAAGIEDTGLGLSDFGVLEILLHKGPLPVNTIGPIVDLTPGSISIAVDRLFAKGLVSRVESAEDRRVRMVALTLRGRALIVSAFRKHSGQIKRVFSELSPEELQGLEVALKKTGKRAAALMEQSD
jgi:MarR family 2-MHQ and catechol resistance regulon transcriptional repressor